MFVFQVEEVWHVVLAEQHVYFQIASTIHTIMLISLNILSAVSLHN